jgi:hypothetical protein
LGILLRMQRVSVVGNSGSGMGLDRHRVYRDRFLRAMICPGCPRLRFIRLTTPGEVGEFLAAAGRPHRGSDPVR